MREEEKAEGTGFGETPHSPEEGGCGPPAQSEVSAIPLKPKDGLNGPPETPAEEMASYWATVRRLEWMIGVAGAVVAGTVGWRVGWVVAACLLLGTAMAWVNFHWLAASVNAIGERIVKSQSGERGAAIVARGVGRIFLIAVCAYVIFTYSARGLVGFLAGLTMPVIAMVCEAVYEFAASIRRPS